MNEWITNRLPKLEEATNEGDVWVYDIEADEYYIRNYEEVIKGQPWMRIERPEPYEKLKRFDVYLEGGSDDDKRFVIAENGWIWAAVPVMGKDGLDAERAYDTAERIAAIYEEVMP